MTEWNVMLISIIFFLGIIMIIGARGLCFLRDIIERLENIDKILDEIETNTYGK